MENTLIEDIFYTSYKNEFSAGNTAEFAASDNFDSMKNLTSFISANGKIQIVFYCLSSFQLVSQQKETSSHHYK